MKLIDLGNSVVKVYDQGVSSFSTANFEEYLKTTDERLLISSVAVRFNDLIKSYANTRLITSSDYKLMFDDPNQLLESKGADRLISAFGAVAKYQEKVIVVDVGTCLTIDIVDNRNYKSGFIYPGFTMLENILSEKIIQLPKPSKQDEKISTESQIYYANVYGFIGSIKEMIARVYESDYKLVLTGGSVAMLLEEHDIDLCSELKNYNPTYDPNLIFEGLQLLSNVIPEN